MTCYPFYYIGSAPDRFIVKARQVTASQMEKQLGRQAMEQQANHPTDSHQRTEPVETPTVRDPERKSQARNAHSLTENGAQKVTFDISTHHSQRLSAGISLGVTNTDVPHRLLSGWMWVMPDRRTIWLRNQRAREPVIFYSSVDGKQRKLVITSITTNSVKGYLLLPEHRTNRSTPGRTPRPARD